MLSVIPEKHVASTLFLPPWAKLLWLSLAPPNGPCLTSVQVLICGCMEGGELQDGQGPAIPHRAKRSIYLCAIL